MEEAKEVLKVPEKKKSKKKSAKFVVEELPVEEIPLIKTIVVPDELKDLSDSVFVAAIKIYAEIKRAEDLNAYQMHQRIAQKFEKYSPELTFGIHIGWGVDGPVGTDFKMDALCLS